MKFSIATVLALASAVLAQTERFNVITKPAEQEEVPAGSTYQIVWQPSAEYPGSIAISLLGGPSQQGLQVVEAIAAGVDPSVGKYDWEVDESLGDLAVYGIMITLESNAKTFQYGFPFKITGGDDSDDETTTTTASATGTKTKSETETETASTSAVATTTSATKKTSSTTVETPSSTLVSSTVRSNLTTTASSSSGSSGSSGAQTTITSVVVEEPTPTASSTSTLATNGVATVAAGGFAMIGGLAMAVLAL